jgi:DNA-binding CsgD family transcriptional regulator
VPPHDIAIENRTWTGIRYILRVLHLHWSNRWTPSQTRALIAQVKQEKTLPKLQIPGKSAAAINAKRGHLRNAGSLGDQRGASKQKYSETELRILDQYAWRLGWSAREVHASGVLPGRSYNSISKKMGRVGYGDPVRVQRAKQARRLTDDERNRLRQCLVGEGRHLSSKELSRQFNISIKAINFYRRRLGVSLSWHEARAVSSTEEKRQRVAEAQRRWLKAWWAKYRQRKIEALLDLQQRLERREHPAPIRVCRACAYPWFALPAFFQVQRRKMPNRLKVSMARTCRICKMKLKQEAEKEESFATAL